MTREALAAAIRSAVHGDPATGLARWREEATEITVVAHLDGDEIRRVGVMVRLDGLEMRDRLKVGRAGRRSHGVLAPDDPLTREIGRVVRTFGAAAARRIMTAGVAPEGVHLDVRVARPTSHGRLDALRRRAARDGARPDDGDAG